MAGITHDEDSIAVVEVFCKPLFDPVLTHPLNSFDVTRIFAKSLFDARLEDVEHFCVFPLRCRPKI